MVFMNNMGDIEMNFLEAMVAVKEGKTVKSCEPFRYRLINDEVLGDGVVSHAWRPMSISAGEMNNCWQIVEEEDTEKRESPYFEYSGEVKLEFARAAEILNKISLTFDWELSAEGRYFWEHVYCALENLAAGRVKKADIASSAQSGAEKAYQRSAYHCAFCGKIHK